jgi:hypothetical protein
VSGHSQDGEVTVIKRIHINQHNIKHNAKNPDDRKCVVSVKTSKGNTYGNKVKIWGESTLVYSPDKPLSCGAKVWIETDDLVTVNNGRENIDL